MTRFKPVKVKTIKELEKILARHAVIFDAKFTNIKPRINQDNYLSESKVFFQNVLQYTRLSESLFKNMLVERIQCIRVNTV